jgi:hypothetical protein
MVLLMVDVFAVGCGYIDDYQSIEHPTRTQTTGPNEIEIISTLRNAVQRNAGELKIIST